MSTSRYTIKAPPGPHIQKTSMLDHALAVEIEKRLIELGVNPIEVRQEGADEQHASWHLYWNTRLSVFAHLYRYNGDAHLYLFFEVSFGAVEDRSKIPYEMSAYLLRENGHMPDAIRLGLDQNNFLVSQVRMRETLIQFSAASYLLKLAITVADNALKNLRSVNGFIGLSDALSKKQEVN